MADLPIWSTLDMSNYVRIHPTVIYESVYCFYGCLPIQKTSYLLSLDIIDLSFWSTMTIPNHTRRQPTDIYESVCCFYDFLSTCKNPQHTATHS